MLRNTLRNLSNQLNLSSPTSSVGQLYDIVSSLPRMSGPNLTVPPPHDDDHEDVAWALRAASAQWRRQAYKDAIQWVQRAADTAESVGNGTRFTELCVLAAALERGVRGGSLPPPPPRHTTAPPSIEVAEVDIDFEGDDDGVEMLDDDDEIEMLDEVEELDDIEELHDEDDAWGVDSEGETDQMGNAPRTAPSTSRPPPPDRKSGRPSSRGPGQSWSVPAPNLPPSSDRYPGPVSTRGASSAPPASRSAESTRAGARTSSRPGARPGSTRPGARSSTSPRSPSTRATGATRSITSTRPGTGGSPSRPPSATTRRVSSSPAPSPDAPAGGETVTGSSEKRRTTTTARRLDRLPPSMRPEPSGLDLVDEAVEEENVSERPSFGELHFDDEMPTHRVDLPSAPMPDLGVPLGGPSELPLAHETAAEYAQSRHQLKHDHEELERELGVNLSVRAGKISREHFAPDWDPGPPPSSRSPWAPSTAPGSDRDDEERIPGRASVRPSSLPPGDRITSAPSEPYPLAPSAAMPPAALLDAPAPSPPSSLPPPPDLMVQADERLSELPSVGTRRPPATEASADVAPDLDEFEDMFQKLSMPPPGPETDIPELERPASQPSEPPDLVVPSSSHGGEIRVDGLDFMELEGFRDLPVDAARALSRTAELRTLKQNEEVSGFGVALVTHGAVQLMPTIADATCRIARQGDVLFTKGTLERSAAVRVVGLEEGSRVAMFSAAALDAATSSCPWVADDLAEIADRYLAFAGAVLGSLGDRLDEMFRFMVLDKCSVKSKAEGTILTQAGESMDGLYVLGAGALELLDADGRVEQQLAMGDFVFPETVLSAAPAARTVRVGKGGALLLYADRMTAHELFATCPPLIEILVG